MSITTRLLVCAPLVASAFGLSACEPSFMRREPTHATTVNAYPIVATMNGDLGSIEGIASNDTDVAISGSPTLTTVRFDVVEPAAQRWAMTRLTIRGGLDQLALSPGARFVWDAPAPGATSTASTQRIFSSVVGCSGPQRDRYTYDSTPRHTEVSVERGSTPTALRLVYTAVFVPTGRAPQTLTGTFEYEPR